MRRANVSGGVCGQDVGRGTRITGEGSGGWCSTSTAQLHGAASGMNKCFYLDKEREEENLMEKNEKKKMKKRK